MKYNHEGCPRHQKHSVNDLDKAFQTTAGPKSASRTPLVSSSSSASLEPEITHHIPEQSHPDDSKTAVNIIGTTFFHLDNSFLSRP